MSFNLSRRAFFQKAAFAAVTIPWVPLASSAQERLTEQASFRGADVAWNPDCWKLNDGAGGVSLLDVNRRKRRDDGYFFWATFTHESLSPTWVTIDDVARLAIPGYFSQGMGGSTVVQEWLTSTSYGWFFTDDFQGGRSLCAMEYRRSLDDSAWVSVSVTVDGAVYDEETCREMIEAVSVNDDSAFLGMELDDLMKLFDENLA